MNYNACCFVWHIIENNPSVCHLESLFNNAQNIRHWDFSISTPVFSTEGDNVMQHLFPVENLASVHEPHGIGCCSVCGRKRENNPYCVRVSVALSNQQFSHGSCLFTLLCDFQLPRDFSLTYTLSEKARCPIHSRRNKKIWNKNWH